MPTSPRTCASVEVTLLSCFCADNLVNDAQRKASLMWALVGQQHSDLCLHEGWCHERCLCCFIQFLAPFIMVKKGGKLPEGNINDWFFEKGDLKSSLPGRMPPGTTHRRLPRSSEPLNCAWLVIRWFVACSQLHGRAA